MPGEIVSVILAMTVNGILDLQVVRGSVNGGIFMDFVQMILLPNLMPFNGTNRNSVVLLTTTQWRSQAGAHWGMCPSNWRLCPTSAGAPENYRC